MTGCDKDIVMNKQKHKVPTTKSSDIQWSMKKTRNHKSSYVLSFVFLITILEVTTFGFTSAYTVQKHPYLKHICRTEDCRISAKLLLDSMNRSVDPCEDFYQFACGNFKNVNKLAYNTHEYDVFKMVDDNIRVHTRDLLEQDGRDDEPYSIKKSKKFYKSCKSTDKIDEIGLTPIVELLNQMHLPLNQYSNLWSVLAKVNKYITLDYLFSIRIYQDGKGILRISILKPERYYNMLSAYKITATKPKMNSDQLRIDESTSRSANEMFFINVWKEILKLQSNYHYNDNLKEKFMLVTSFQNILNAIFTEDTSNTVGKSYTLSELQSFTDEITNNYPYDRKFDWYEYIKTQFDGVDNVVTNFRDERIIVYDFPYIKDVLKVLASNPINMIGEHVTWEIISTFLPFTTSSMIKTIYRLSGNTLTNIPRDLQCAKAVNNVMGFAVTNMLNSINFVKQKKELLFDMMLNIHEAFEDQINEAKWLDEASKTKTLYKARRMKEILAYPDFVMNSTELDYYYSDLEIKEDDFFGNILRCKQRSFNQMLSVYGPLDKKYYNIYTKTPYEVNAFNAIIENKIVVPIGVLQYPMFGHNLQVLNYGYLGFILGHEVSHSFDNAGRTYDADGTHVKWWSEDSTQKFSNLTTCLIKQYNSFSFPGMKEKVNGSLTLNENIADNGGIRAGLWAYRKFVSENGEEDKLPGLEDLSHEQIYFLAFSNLWCETTDDPLLTCLPYDVHSPRSVRVTGTLMNSEEFSQAWKCEKGTKMNPYREKCRIW